MTKNEENQAQPSTDSTTEQRSVATAPEVSAALAKQAGITHRIKETQATDVSEVSELPQPPAIDDDPKTDAAVDDILSDESDQLLADEDAKTTPPAPKKRGFFRRFWHNKWARSITILVILAAIGTVVVMPKTRYAVLNRAGVRSSASLVVVDSITKLPLKNVTVTFGDKQAKTDVNGVARVTSLTLGPRDIRIQRLAFAPYNTHVTIGWGSNPLGTFALEAVGTRYEFYVVDALSGKPIGGASAESDQASTISDTDGKVTLTLDDASVTQLKVHVTNNGYLAQDVTLNATQKDKPHVGLLPDQKVVYVSKQSGTYDVYSSNLDGSERKVLLKGTGAEDGNISLVVSPDNTQAALVSTRDDQRDSSGTALVALTIITIGTGTSSTVDHAQQIQPIDWIGNRLIYRSTVATGSNDTAGRNRLVSYDYAQNAKTQLATAAQFNLVMSAKGALYYAASSTDPSATLGLFTIKPDGTGKEQLSQQEVWTGLRTSYDTLALQTQDGWSALTLSTKQITASTAPGSFKSYSFVPSPKGTDSAWIDVRGGTTTLLLHHDGGTDATLATQGGIVLPIHWLSDTLLSYRISNSIETAEYVINTSGGLPKKVADVVPAYGFTDIY